MPTLTLTLILGCGRQPDPDVQLPDPSAATFVAGIDHPYMPMPIGATWAYDSVDGAEHIDVEVLADTRVVNGVNATVVYDAAFLDGVLVEETWDWYAQDNDGNVWYLGEDTCEVENGACVNHHGAWEWGVDGAVPGWVMPATPTVGQTYYQEWYAGEAEDVGEVVEIGGSVEVPGGSFTDCVRTHDTSTLDTTLDEFKYACDGVGYALIDEPDTRVELTASNLPETR